VLDDLPVVKAAFIEHSDLEGYAIWWPHYPAEIRAAPRHPHPNFVIDGDHLFDGQVEIREGLSQKLDIALQAFNCCVQPELMLDEVGLEVLAQHLVMALIERFGDDFTKRRLVLFRWHVVLLLAVVCRCLLGLLLTFKLNTVKLYSILVVSRNRQSVKRNMTKSRKPKRQYNSSRRQAQARQTRQQVIAAARQLFVEYGYAGATIDAIAQEAGVASETIFATFGSKRAILADVINTAVSGDQPVPVLEQPGPQAVMQQTEPEQVLELFAADISSRLERVAPVFAVMRAAAQTEPDIAELLKNQLEIRLRNISTVAQRLAAQEALREDLNVKQAAEVIWTITSPEVFSLLTVDRGWVKERYVHWLGDTLIRLLLP
jgi:AcrR family transcriptional regulator